MFGWTSRSTRSGPDSGPPSQKGASVATGDQQDKQKQGGAPSPASLAQSTGREPAPSAVDTGALQTSEPAFVPSEHTAAEVRDELADATAAEKAVIAGQEQAGDNRKSVLKAAGVAEGQRFDKTGREMHPWEVPPKQA